MNKEKIRRINAALPAKSYDKIAESTGFSYGFVYKTLNGYFKTWNDNHSKVTKEARKIIERVQSEL